MNRNELYHHGIKGQRWGIRRFQNKDGTLTSAGKRRYDDKRPKMDKETKRTIATAIGVAGVATAVSGAIIASAKISEIRVNKAADRAIRKAQGFVTEYVNDKNLDVSKSATKGFAYLNKILARQQ